MTPDGPPARRSTRARPARRFLVNAGDVPLVAGLAGVPRPDAARRRAGMATPAADARVLARAEARLAGLGTP